jgi:hypothetical protein
MAMIDYGAILKKNGKIVNRNRFFMNMETAVGWTDYPHVKYEDCDCIDGDGYSDCLNCPRANRKYYANEKDYWLINDCRGIEPNSNHMEGNWFAYAGDTEFVVGFYKQMVMTWYKGEQKIHWLRWDYAGKYSINIEVGGTKLHFKALSNSKSVYYGRFRYKGDLYEVVFGYGIDPDQSTWNRVKKTYCDKKTIKFIDKFWEEN